MMNQILNLVGTIASIGSIPLAIYLYLKSIEDKKDRVRRDILRALSYQIGENRKLDLFEVSKVIHSNCRNNKIGETAIEIESILEDLISDTISNPLLESQRKDQILENIKSIFPTTVSKKPAKAEVRKSSVYLIIVLFTCAAVLSVFVIIGEKEWNSAFDKLMSFNTVKGFWANLFVSLVLSILAITITFLASRRPHNKKKR
jgi:hypothetical protein